MASVQAPMGGFIVRQLAHVLCFGVLLVKHSVYTKWKDDVNRQQIADSRQQTAGFEFFKPAG